MKNRLVNKVDDLVEFVLSSKIVRSNPGLLDVCLFAKRAARFIESDEVRQSLAFDLVSKDCKKELKELLNYNFEDFFDEEDYLTSDDSDDSYTSEDFLIAGEY